MKTFMKQGWLFVVGGILSLYTLAQADTLKMHDGKVFSGTYQGGAQDSIRFEVDSETQEYSLTGVQILHFGEAAGSQPSGQNILNIPADKHLLLDKNGQFVAGLYQGGTKDSIRFQGDERIQEYRVADILFIMFGKAASAQTTTNPQTATNPQTGSQGQEECH